MMTRALAPPGASTGVTYQGAHSGALQVDTLFIGTDGALYVQWVVSRGIGTGDWSRPVRISSPNLAPPGAPVAVGARGFMHLAVYPDAPSGTDAVLYASQVNVFFIGNDGALYVATVIGLGEWEEPVRISPLNVAPPGGSVATGYQTSQQLDVFFIGKNGALYVSWAKTSGISIRDWNGPVGISPPNIAPAGARLVAFNQLPNQLTVLYFGINGALHVSWVVGLENSRWDGPVVISPPDIAPAGAGLSIGRPTMDQWNLFFIGKNGVLNYIWVRGGGQWQGPVVISPPNIAPPGGGIISGPQTIDQLSVFFIGSNGSLNVSWFEPSWWQGPVGISPPNIAPPGAPLAMIFQANNQLSVFVNGRERWLFWVVGKGIWQGPFTLPN